MSHQTVLSRKVLNDVSDIGSINRGFRVRSHVYAYEQSKKGLSDFYPKCKLHSAGLHPDPLDMRTESAPSASTALHRICMMLKQSVDLNSTTSY